MSSGASAGGRVGLLGHGLLYEAIEKVLGKRSVAVAERAVATVTPDPGRAGLAMVVVASDAWDTSGHAVARALAAGRVPWLPVHTELSDVVIGPREEPGRPGCVDCAGERRRRVHPDSPALAKLRQRHGERLATRPSSWVTGLAAHVVATLVVEEVDGAAGSPPRTRAAMLKLGLERLTISRHPFLPDPSCPVCGTLPDDSPQQASPTLAPRRAHRPGSFRAQPIATELDRLTRTYVDREAGLVGSLELDSVGGVATAFAPVGLRVGHGETGFGRSASFHASRLTALLEALERYGSTPGGRRTTVAASYRELGQSALDPRTLGLYPPQRYALPGFGFRPFTPDRVYRWVWGWSFGRGEPLLVPERCAYYRVPPRADDPGFVYEISNGCALGSCLEEAILYGILEVAERDAFLLTWYARLPVPRIELTTARDRTVPLLAAAIRAETGYHVHAFDTTVEQGIPCVWALATNPTLGDDRPALACAAGAHPDPEQAVAGALAELGPALTGLVERYAMDGQAERARAMAAHPSLVRQIADHALLYADPGAAARLEFLTGSPRVRPFDRVGRADRGGFASEDLHDNLQEAVKRFVDSGLEVVVVDQTTPEHRAGGLHCVKVLIPGTLSMTFGHHHRRVDGLRRLYHVPPVLGHRDQPLRPEDVNPYPHPFP